MDDGFDSEVWTEKYRPKNFEDMVGQEEIIKRVKALVNSLNILSKNFKTLQWLNIKNKFLLKNMIRVTDRPMYIKFFSLKSVNWKNVEKYPTSMSPFKRIEKSGSIMPMLKDSRSMDIKAKIKINSKYFFCSRFKTKKALFNENIFKRL